MATLEDYRESTFVSYCIRALETFAADTPGVKNVLLATPDGFEIAASVLIGRASCRERV